MLLGFGFAGKCLAGGVDLEGINFQKVREDKNPEGIRFTPEFQAVNGVRVRFLFPASTGNTRNICAQEEKKKKKAQYFIFFHLSEFKNKHFEVKGL